MTPRISARIAAIAESATLAVDGKAKALKAAGRPVIGFGAGEPDFPTPDYIVEAAAAATKVVANHRYTPTPGLPDLRDAIVAKTKRDSNYEITADQVLVTNGQPIVSQMGVTHLKVKAENSSALMEICVEDSPNVPRVGDTLVMTIHCLDSNRVDPGDSND